MPEKNKPTIKTGKPASQLNDPWYKRKGNPTDIVQMLKEPSKAIGYFKVRYRSRGGVREELQLWKTLSNGYMVYVDVANIKMGVSQGTLFNRGIQHATKSEFTKAFKLVLKALSI